MKAGKKKRKLNWCIGNPHDGCVIKEFPSKESFDAYIKYVHTLPDNEENFDLFEYVDCGRGKCIPGNEYVEVWGE